MTQHQLITYLIMTVVVILAVRRNMRGRKLRVETLWVFPAILVAISGFVLAAEPAPSLPVMAGMAAAAVVGGAIGWQRGKFTRIVLDPQTHAFTSQASPIALLILGGLFVVRFALRGYFLQSSADPHVALAVTDILLLFAVGMIMVQRLEMGLRCRKMLADAKAAPP